MGEAIGSLAALAAEYQHVLDQAKRDASSPEFDWYPHDTLGQFCLLEELLAGLDVDFDALLKTAPALDLCCGDGDLAFFLASLGCEVDAVDWPPTNYNGMRGLARLKQALGAPVQIRAMDLNAFFELPRARYGVVFLLGALYHLKNPILVLEEIAKRAEYCVLSTRVARFSPDRRTEFGSLPVAYLVGPDETNADLSNYWIFSEAGLRRVLSRANWSVEAMMCLGAQDSDPASAEGDRRAYCLLRSTVQHSGVELLRGVHLPEQGDWRWTERRFSVKLYGSRREGARLMLPVFLPDSAFERHGAVTLTASSAGAVIASFFLCEPGPCECLLPVPLAAGESAVVDFELDKALPPDDTDRRERGIILPRVHGA